MTREDIERLAELHGKGESDCTLQLRTRDKARLAIYDAFPALAALALDGLKYREACAHNEKLAEFVSKQNPLDPKFVELVNERFWDLLMTDDKQTGGAE